MSLFLVGLSDKPRADPLQDRKQICDGRQRFRWEKGTKPEEQLTHGLLSALCSLRKGAAYHAVIIWSAAGTTNSELWKNAAKDDNILRVLESFALDDSVDLSSRVNAIDALGDLARYAGKTDGERTVVTLLARKSLDPVIISAALRSISIIAPDKLAEFALGTLMVIPNTQFLDFIIALPRSRQPISEVDFRNAIQRLDRLDLEAARERDLQLRKKIASARLSLLGIATKYPQATRIALAPMLLASVPRRSTLTLLELESTSKRQLAIQSFGSTRSPGTLLSLLQIFSPEDDENEQIASAISGALNKIGLDKIRAYPNPSVRGTIPTLLSKWNVASLRALSIELQGIVAAPDSISTRDAEAQSSYKLLLSQLTTEQGESRAHLLKRLLLIIAKADDLDTDELASALKASPSARNADLKVIRAVAEANDESSSSAVTLIGELDDFSTRHDDILSLRRLVRQNKGTESEGSALDLLQEWMTDTWVSDKDKEAHAILLREMIRAEETSIEAKAIDLLYSTPEMRAFASDMTPLRDVLLRRKGSDADEKALSILAKRGDPTDYELIRSLIDPDYDKTIAAMQAAREQKITGTAPNLKKVLAARRTQDQVREALDTVAVLHVRDAVDEVLQTVLISETEELRVKSRPFFREEIAARGPQDHKSDDLVRKALDVLLELDKTQKFSDDERNRVGKGLINRLTQEADSEIAVQLAVTLGAIRYTNALSEVLTAISRPDSSIEAQRAKRQAEGLGKGLLGLVGSPIPTVLPILRATRRNSFEEPRFRGAAHLAGGDDPRAEALIAALGPEAPFQAYVEGLERSRFIDSLEAFVAAYQLPDTTIEDKTEITERARELAGKWCAATPSQESSFLEAAFNYFHRFWTAATAPLQKDCTVRDVAEPLSKLASLSGDDTLKRLATPSMFLQLVKEYWHILLIHPLAWLALMLFYPRSKTIQSMFFWNRWGRMFLGLFYVHFLVTYVPPIRRRLLQPLEPDLLDGAGTRMDEPEPFFADIHVTDGNRDLGVALNVLLGKSNEAAGLKFAAGPVLVSGASGLGKSALLRQYSRKLRAARRSTVVFLTASACAQGVQAAVLERLKINAPSEDNYIRTLVHTGGLVIVIDGVNEVDAETRVKIATFVSTNRRGRIVLATQPSVWGSESIPRLELQPLAPDQIEAFLEVYDSTRPDNSTIEKQEYLTGVHTFSTAALALADDKRRSLLSRPVMLTIVSRLVWLGEEPQLDNLVEQIVTLAEVRHTYFSQGVEFPRQAFSDYIWERSMQSQTRNFPHGDFTSCWVALTDQRLAQPSGPKNPDNLAEEYAFTHELFLAFYLSAALFPSNLAEVLHRSRNGESLPENKIRWQAALDKVEQFRSAFLYFGDTGSEEDVRAFAGVWKTRWLETNDRFYREFEMRLDKRFPSQVVFAAAA
jgi:hypothetical protein